MAYNNIHKIEYYMKVVELTNKYYIPGVTTYSGIFRKHVLPVYPMSYAQYIKILGMPNLKKQYEEAKSKKEATS
jgi:hypothetical protein